MPGKNRRNYYRILHVQPDAPTEVIKSSYRALMLKLQMHPDHGGEHWSATVINEAYAILSDPARRADYDRAFDRPLGFGRATRGGSGSRAADDGLPRCVFCGRSVQGGTGEGERCRSCQSPLAAAVSLDIGSPDQRLVDRISRRGWLRYFTEWPQERTHAGHLEDVSPNGLRFAGDSHVVEHQILKIESEALTATARVVHCRRRPKRGLRYAIGADFYTLELRRPTGTFFSTRA